MKIALCNDIEPSRGSGEIQGIEKIELLRCCFAGVAEGGIADMRGVFLDPGKMIECRARTGIMFSSF